MYTQKKILHVITGTEIGGAEISLLNLLTKCNSPRFSSRVVSLARLGPVADKLKEKGIQVDSLDMAKGRFNLRAFINLVIKIRDIQPNLIHCWMYHANLFGGLAGWFTHVPVIWSIHHHSIDKTLLKKKTVWIIRLGAFLSGSIPRKILFASKSAIQTHTEIGYDERKAVAIPNGFDITYYQPDISLGAELRKTLTIPSRVQVIGHIGRFDPTKDHKTFIEAADLISKDIPDTHFILCGRGIDRSNEEIMRWITQAGIEKQVHLLGEQEDLRGIYNAIDLLIQSSISEALPNVLGEAMACGIPCIATDVGDSAYIITDTGYVVKPGNAQALADAAVKMLTDKEKHIIFSNKARKRIIEKFSINTMIESYQALLDAII